MELIAEFIRAQSRNCIGCNRHNRDIMISVKVPDTETEQNVIHDIFLTQDQAKQFALELAEQIDRNDA